MQTGHPHPTDGNTANASLDALTAFPWIGRAVLLVDLDAFFASVEQLDHPAWRGKPVIVGGHSDRRGVVSTASYEARKYGVHSAMPSITASRLCPDAIWTEGHYDRYREMSNMVMQILHDETPHVQQVSIDEAFLDVTPTSVNTEHPVDIARRIQSRVEKLGVTCSIGIGTTKAVAKLASDMDKPRGLTVVLPGSERNFLDPQPIRALSGIGAASEKKLKAHGIETLGDLARADDELVMSLLGKNGRTMLDRSRGVDADEVSTDDTVKSVSNEMSFAQNLTERDDIEAAIDMMAAKVARRLRRKGLNGTTIALKVRFDNLSVKSVQRPIEIATPDEHAFSGMLHVMLDDVWQPGIPLRLVGVAVTGFDTDRGPKQATLFDLEDDGNTSRATTMSEQREKLHRATDLVKEKFGESSLQYGRELRLRGRDTGTTSKNPADYK